MTFNVEKINEFIDIFDSVKNQILNFPGCKKVKLLRNIQNSAVIFTYSEWDSEEDLNNYRNSSLFKATWFSVKALFSEPPEAWSMAQSE